MSKRSVFIVIIAVMVISALTFLVCREQGPEVSAVSEGSTGDVAEVDAEANEIAEPGERISDSETEESEDVVIEEEDPSVALSDEERRADVAEKAVNDFDDETDKWMDAEKKHSPSMKEIEAYHEKFRSIPKDRKEECLQRALNLLPDENVMLLVGILMDKSEDEELIQQIYNDVLNRDESVKKPILQTIFQDKTHQCWADTAWILDVTGELPTQDSVTTVEENVAE